MKSFKLNKIKLLIFILAILVILFSIYLFNNTEMLNNLFGTEIKQETEEQKEFFSYFIYDNADNEKLKVSVIFNSHDNGIEYIQKPDGEIIYTNGKMEISIDYVCKLGVEETFIIKEVGKDVKQEVLMVPESGNEEAPFTIANADQLQNITNNPLLKRDSVYNVKECYKLINDIDLSGIDWKPIGDPSNLQIVLNSFFGELDGDGHIISNLNIDSEESYQGLFAFVTGTIKNVKLENFVVKGQNYVGALVGYSTNEISNCELKNSQIIATGSNIGGLIGRSGGNVTGNIINAVSVEGGQYTGGLIGTSTSVTTNNTVDVTVTGKAYTGGLIGNAGNVTNGNTVNANVTGENYTGGLIGYTSSVCERNIVQTTVTGIGYVGGLIGSSAKLIKANTVNNTIITGQNIVGGLIGYTNANVSENNVNNVQIEAKGDKIQGTGNMGGLIGHVVSNGELTVNSNKVKVTIEGEGSYIGGLIGNVLAKGNNTTRIVNIFDNYTTGNILVTGDNVGGLIGLSNATGNGNGGKGYFYLQNSYSVMDIKISGAHCGGLIGYYYTLGTGSSYSGQAFSSIKNCFSIGNVEGSDSIGGCVGVSELKIGKRGSIARGDITNSYSLGKVIGQTNLGAVIGIKTGNDTSVSNVFWESGISGIESSAYGTKVDLSNMFSQELFKNWNFNNIWQIDEGSTLPYLKNLDKPDAVNKANIDAMPR